MSSASSSNESRRPKRSRKRDRDREPKRDRELERHAAIRDALDAVRARCDVKQRRAADPVEFVHAYANPDDRELVALIASSLAFGNVKALRAKIRDALDRIGPQIAAVADDPPALARCLRGWKHRVYRDSDLIGLLVGARRVQRSAGSLGAALAAELARTGDLRTALSAWVSAIRCEGGLEPREPQSSSPSAAASAAASSVARGAAHILADPGKGSAVKRLMLLLRWMSRPADGVDLGLWPLPPSRLVMPVDTHIHKLSRNLGFTDRRDVSWKTAEEITAAMRRFDPDDPVKYDFALCHMGMLQSCPSRRDPDRCQGCGILSVCKHWNR